MSVLKEEEESEWRSVWGKLFQTDEQAWEIDLLNKWDLLNFCMTTTSFLCSTVSYHHRCCPDRKSSSLDMHFYSGSACRSESGEVSAYKTTASVAFPWSMGITSWSLKVFALHEVLEHLRSDRTAHPPPPHPTPSLSLSLGGKGVGGGGGGGEIRAGRMAACGDLAPICSQVVFLSGD